jgi:Predicted metal-dependent phosphoesterases (PHP family)
MNSIRGSEWRRWDLHFHTPSSYDYADKGITNQQIIDELAKNQISVVAITDHHVIDIARVSELQTLGDTQGVTVLPGIEFLSDARGEEPIHFIAIFGRYVNLNFVWKQLEGNTDIKRIEGEGKQLNEVYCHLLDTIKLIKELGGIVTIHAGKKSNGIENITHALPHGVAQKEDIANAIDVFEMGKETDCVGYNQHVIPYLKNKIGKHIPMIICTDNHKVTEYTVKQNLWIKADTTFEGLKQIIYEPEHRVRIQESEPDFKEDKLVIDCIRFISDNNTFTPEPIYLNKNLNVIIGGKSSGKSIMLYNIAKTLLADKNFFHRENIADKYDFRKDDQRYNFEVKTKGGFSQYLYRDANENSIIPEIKYIPQNYLVKLAEPQQSKKGAALNKIVRELIKEDPNSREIYDRFVSELKVNDRKREQLIDSYFDIKSHIESLRVQLQSKARKEILEQNIKTNTQKVEQLNQSTGMDQAQIDRFNHLQHEQELTNQELGQFRGDIKKVIDYNTEVIGTLIGLQSKHNLVLSSLEHPRIREIFNQKSLDIQKAIAELNEFIRMFETTNADDGSIRLKNATELSALLEFITAKSKQNRSALEPFLNNEAIKRQIETITKSISDDKAALIAIEQLTKEISENQIVLDDIKKQIFLLYRENYELYGKLFTELSSRTLNLESDGLKITGMAKFNFNKFRQSIWGFSDGRTASYNRYSICDEKLEAVSNYDFEKLVTDMEAIFISIVEKGDYALSSRVDKKNALKSVLDDYFFDYWEIEYKGDKLGKMSTGKASFVILMLIVGLSTSKAPILIDQPEDNLDNRSITADLVEYLRNKKLERQIILVTHNPNIVVNADAENIIIANQKGQNESDTSSPYQFDYINGALENTFPLVVEETDLLKSMGIREHIAEIVEGGKEAFMKREEKYGF